MLAKDIMRRRVITAGPTMTLSELARLFIDRRISGVPVVSQGRLLGVVSQTDLVRQERERSGVSEIPGYYREGDEALTVPGYHVEEPAMTRVEDIMTPIVIAVEEKASIEDAAKLMLSKHIHRILVTRAGKLRGIISSLDLLRAMLIVKRKPHAAVRR
ncbi:MAG: CBS domain-containing protein [Elusimicrobia bacterium]|nr:CBS domain-containing protein [Elusimicrobiota bacterium]